MTERFDPRPEGPEIQLPIDLTELTTEQASRYLDQIIDHIEAGHPTWVSRDLVAESGRVYDFYFKGGLQGFVDHEYTDSYSAFTVEAESDGPVEIYNGRSKEEAMRAVETVIIESGPTN